MDSSPEPDCENGRNGPIRNAELRRPSSTAERGAGRSLLSPPKSRERRVGISRRRNFVTIELDPDLVERGLAGDRLAFQGLVEQTWGLVFVFIRQRVSDQELARDLAQDTFLQAFAKRESLRKGRSFVSWLLAIASNKVIDQRRRRSARPEVGLNEDSPELPAEPLEESPFAEKSGSLDTALAALDDLYRTVLILRYWSGLTPAQIARLLGEPEGTIRNRIFRAHIRLREQLTKLEPGEAEIRSDHQNKSSRQTEGGRR